MGGVLPSDDADKATAMGFGPAMAAIKTYGIWSSFMAYLVETSFRKSMEEYGKCEEELSHAQWRVTELSADVKKYEVNKKVLECKLGKLAKEVKEALARIKSLENDLEVARSKLNVALEDPTKAETAIVPEAERILTLRATLEKCKLEVVSSFDNGFHSAMAQIQVLHPDIDLLERIWIRLW